MSPKPFAVVFCGVLALSGAACKNSTPDGLARDQARWPENVLAAEVRPLDTSRMAADEFSQLLGQAASVPGVEQVALVDVLPSAERPRTQIDIDGRPSPLRPGGFVQVVSPGYFATMELKLIQGRIFQAADVESSPTVAIVNQSYARRVQTSGDTIGHRLRIGRGSGPWLTIVGVVQDGPEAWKAPEVYVPLAQQAANGPSHSPWYLVGPHHRRSASRDRSIAAAASRAGVSYSGKAVEGLQRDLEPVSSFSPSTVELLEPHLLEGLRRQHLAGESSESPSGGDPPELSQPRRCRKTDAHFEKNL